MGATIVAKDSRKVVDNPTPTSATSVGRAGQFISGCVGKSGRAIPGLPPARNQCSSNVLQARNVVDGSIGRIVNNIESSARVIFPTP